MENNEVKVLMIASECRELAKIGGLGDVVNELSRFLMKNNVSVKVAIPYYENIIRKDTEEIGKYKVTFAGKEHLVRMYKYILFDDVEVYLIHNDYFFGGKYGEVYIDSDKLHRGPFEDDALRFAFFSKALLDIMSVSDVFGNINLLHCHDWHTGVFLTLLNYDSRYASVKARSKTVFTIHNLDYQGTRPFYIKKHGQYESFESWFPDLYKVLKAGRITDKLKDNVIKPLECFNSLKAGIVLADMVNTVSPTYADEITQPDNHSTGFVAGRGLENELNALKSDGRLVGILNGLDYNVIDPLKLDIPFDTVDPDFISIKKLLKNKFIHDLKDCVEKINIRSKGKFKNYETVKNKVAQLDPDVLYGKLLMVAVTRVVKQKMGIILEMAGSAQLLSKILGKDIFFVLIGTGELEDKLEVVNKFENGIFINSFDNETAMMLYNAGDMFFMPSDFEPCGISQMIAMRYGTVPFVRDIGGLHDTVKDRQTGFIYSGGTRSEQHDDLICKLDEAINIYFKDILLWNKIAYDAAGERFDWKRSVNRYIKIYKELLSDQAKTKGHL